MGLASGHRNVALTEVGREQARTILHQKYAKSGSTSSLPRIRSEHMRRRGLYLKDETSLSHRMHGFESATMGT